MSLLATLGLEPVRKGGATRSRGAKAPMAPVATAATVATEADPNGWAESIAANPPKEIATPYGPYYADWLDEAAVVPAVAAALAAMPEGREAHGKATTLATKLAKVVKQVEAGPSTPAEVAALVKRHANAAANNAAETAENSENVLDLLTNLIEAAEDDLKATRSQWETALRSKDIVDGRHEAAELKSEVEAEKQHIDDSLALIKSIWDVGTKSLKGEVVDVAFEVLDLAAKAYHEVNGRERLAQADKLEKKARSAEMLNLAQAIATAGDQARTAVVTMNNLHERVDDIRKDLERQRKTAVVRFDEGSNGKTTLKLTPFVQVLEAASVLRGLAAKSAARAKAADRAIDALVRATPNGRAKDDACERVIVAMRQETKGWAVAANEATKHCDALTARYRLLCDTALDAMKGSVKGQSIDELTTL